MADMLAEEILRDLDMDAGAVAGLAVGIDSAAMPQRLERADRGRDDGAARLAVKRRDEAHAAGIVLLGGVVEAGGLEPGGVGAELVGEAHGGALKPG